MRWMPARRRVIACAALTLLVLTSCATKRKHMASQTPALSVVNARMDAYNRHDLEAFLATYAEHVRIFTYPDRSLGSGKAHMRRLFAPVFAAGKNSVKIHHQIAKDGYVVNHETVTSDGQRTEYVSVYEVRDGRIVSVRFIRD